MNTTLPRRFQNGKRPIPVFSIFWKIPAAGEKRFFRVHDGGRQSCEPASEGTSRDSLDALFCGAALHVRSMFAKRKRQGLGAGGFTEAFSLGDSTIPGFGGAVS